jgi:hypothetical protein
MSGTCLAKLDGARLGRLVVPLSAFAIYLLTLAPTVQGFDSAELTVGAYSLGFVHAPGYPLYMLLGHGFSRLPLGDVGMRLNLMSAVFAGLTVMVLMRLVERDSEHPLVTVSVVGLCATSPIFWSQAVRAEVYTLHLFLMVSVLALWRRARRSNRPAWHLAPFVLLGLAMGNHLTALLLWGALLICLIWEAPRVRWLTVAGTGLGVLTGCLLYLYFPLRSAANPAIDYIRPYFATDLSSPAGVWWLFSARMFHHAFYLQRDLDQVASELLRLGRLLWDSYLGVGGILGMWGWWQLGRQDPRWNRLLSLYFLGNLVGFALYHVVDKEIMFIPALAIWSVWVASGAAEASRWLAQRIKRYPAEELSAYVGGALLTLAVVGAAFNWQTVSLRGNRRVIDYGYELLRQVESSTLVVNHWVTASVLDYLKLVEGRRPDVTSYNLDFHNLALQERHVTLESAAAQTEWRAWLEQALSQRPLCFVEPLPEVPEHYRWEEGGICWKLTLASQHQ